jgi:hypothetical protein
MDAQDCLEKAKRCIELANEAKDDKTQSMLFELARAWTELANELNTNPSLREAASQVEVFKSKPIG